MTDEQPDDSKHSNKAALPTMRERARDYIHLMFLVDDFQRASTLNKLVVEGAANMLCGPLSEEFRSNLEHKVCSEMLLILEMARNLTIRGEALIKQAEAVMSRIPSWDEP
jgi:3-deoxy-D-arabino-heptulosonate 7-phosphate (DAHP) synthase class II